MHLHYITFGFSDVASLFIITSSEGYANLLLSAHLGQVSRCLRNLHVASLFFEYTPPS